MRTEHILRMLGEIVAEHNGPYDSGIRVIPVVGEGAAEDAGPLLEAVARHAGGVLVRANDPVVAAGLECVNDPILGAAIEAVAIPGPGGRTTYPKVSDEGDGFRVEVGSSSADILNPGHGALAGLFTSLLHKKLRDRELAFLVYDELPLDKQLRRVAWSFLTQHLPGLSFGHLRTLVVMAESAKVDYALHCQGRTSARYVLRGEDEPARRRDYDFSASRARTVASDAEGSPRVFFLAAGVSASSAELPMGNELRDLAIRTVLQGISVKSSELEARFWRFLSQEDLLDAAEVREGFDYFRARLTLERVLLVERKLQGRSDSSTIRYFEERHAKALASPGRAVKELVRSLQSGRPTLLLTVNFDELPESLAAGRIRQVVSDEEFDALSDSGALFDADGKRVNLLKLHGTISKPESLVATIDDTRYGLSEAKRRVLRMLPDIGGSVPWIYVGSSMRDIDIRAEVSDPMYADAFEEYWVAPVLDHAISTFVESARLERWRRAGRPSLRERSLTLTADEFFAALH